MRWNQLQLRVILMASVLILPCVARSQQSALDLDGREVNPLTADPGKIVVLVFLRRDCPVSARYAPVIEQIAQEYSDRARFWLVYPDKTDSPAAIREHLAEFGYTLPALRDAGHVLVKMARVRITPEVAVFDPARHGRHLVYDGRIDDLYISSDRIRPAATTHELKDAIVAAIAGDTVAHNEVRGVGCYISDLE
jgi:thiol-disulfide isomerase/thioredoxin